MKNAHREFWNQRQQALRRALSGKEQHQKVVDLFLDQHAMVYSSQLLAGDMNHTLTWSFDDEVWQDLTEETVRRIPRSSEHSVAWVFWHLARIEDVTMNLLAAGTPQIFNQDGWLEAMKVETCDTGNALDEAGIRRLSETVDVEALRSYRLAVGRRTRDIVCQLQPELLKQRVDPSRLQRVMAEGAVIEASRGLLDYWGSLTIAGLLLMPPTRHNFIHLNEALRLKQKRS